MEGHRRASEIPWKGEVRKKVDVSQKGHMYKCLVWECMEYLGNYKHWVGKRRGHKRVRIGSWRPFYVRSRSLDFILLHGRILTWTVTWYFSKISSKIPIKGLSMDNGSGRWRERGKWLKWKEVVADRTGGGRGKRENSMTTPRFLTWTTRCLEYRIGILEIWGIFLLMF